MKSFKCNNCKKDSKKYPSHKGKYCSNECQIAYQRKNYIDEWKSGKQEGTKGKFQLSNHIRAYLFEINDNKCSLCGWGQVNPYTGLIPLEIDHVDGNAKNNKPENLKLLCPNCHSLTSTWKGSNRGKGIKERHSYFSKKLLT